MINNNQWIASFFQSSKGSWSTSFTEAQDISKLQCWWKSFFQSLLAVNVLSTQSTDHQQGPVLLINKRTRVNRPIQITDAKSYQIKFLVVLPLSDSTYSIFSTVFPWCGMNCNSDSHSLPVIRTGRVRHHVVTKEQFWLWLISEFQQGQAHVQEAPMWVEQEKHLRIHYKANSFKSLFYITPDLECPCNFLWFCNHNCSFLLCFFSPCCYNQASYSPWIPN